MVTPAQMILMLRVAAVLVAVCGAAFLVHYVIDLIGDRREEKIEVAIVKKTLEDKEALDEIRNARPDADAVIDRLRKHTF